MTSTLPPELPVEPIAADEAARQAEAAKATAENSSGGWGDVFDVAEVAVDLVTGLFDFG